MYCLLTVVALFGVAALADDAQAPAVHVNPEALSLGILPVVLSGSKGPHIVKHHSKGNHTGEAEKHGEHGGKHHFWHGVEHLFGSNLTHQIRKIHEDKEDKGDKKQKIIQLIEDYQKKSLAEFEKKLDDIQKHIEEKKASHTPQTPTAPPTA